MTHCEYLSLTLVLGCKVSISMFQDNTNRNTFPRVVMLPKTSLRHQIMSHHLNNNTLFTFNGCLASPNPLESQVWCMKIILTASHSVGKLWLWSNTPLALTLIFLRDWSFHDWIYVKISHFPSGKKHNSLSIEYHSMRMIWLFLKTFFGLQLTFLASLVFDEIEYLCLTPVFCCHYESFCLWDLKQMVHPRNVLLDISSQIMLPPK